MIEITMHLTFYLYVSVAKNSHNLSGNDTFMSISFTLKVLKYNFLQCPHNQRCCMLSLLGLLSCNDEKS